MIFTVRVEHYQEWNNSNATNSLFVCANTFEEVAEKISSYYGEDCLNSMNISCFSPDDFLIFDEEHTEEFCDIKNKLGEKIVW